MPIATPINHRIRVKMCGFTRSEDINAAVKAGADAIGFVFYPKSKRCVSLAQAAALRQQVPAFVQCVALFVNAKPAFVRQVIQQVQPDLLQFHGDESVAYCESFQHPYLRAFRAGAPTMDTPESLLSVCRQYPRAQGWLVDSYSAGYGGSGLRFDDALLSALQQQHRDEEPPLVLAGGINHENVRASIALHQPFAIDISSAIETAPGIKSAEKMHTFMQQLAHHASY